MWFLIKASFWFSLVLAALPLFKGGLDETTNEGPKVEAVTAITAVAGTINYMTKICTERPEVCEAGAETAVALGNQARAGARIAYNMLEDNSAVTDQPNPVVVDTTLTGTIIPIPQPRPALQ